MRIAPLDLRREDFPDLQGPRLERLLRSLNEFASSIAPLLNGGLTAANFKAFSKEITVRGAAGLPISFKNELGTTPEHVFLTRAVTVAESVETPATLGNPAWATSKDQIVISAVTGISGSTVYRLRLIVLAK